MLTFTLLQGKDISSAEAIRNLNRAQVLDAIRSLHPISYGDLVAKVQLSRTTISSIVNEMFDLGLIVKVGQAASTGGRRPILVGYNPAAKMAVGATMFDNEIKAVLTDLEGAPLKFEKRPWSGTRLEDLVEQMNETVLTVCSAADYSRILGVGVGLPGVVDVAEGRIVEYVTTGRQMDGPIEVRQMMEDALHLPVIVANRSRTAALGEMKMGVGQDVHNLFYLSIGRGIVAGLVFNDDIFLGTNYSAGEIGHNTVVADGALCGCGNHGCLEMYASDRAIVAQAIANARKMPDSLLRQVVRDGNLQMLTLDLILDCARQGDAAALEVINETGKYIGIALSDAINILNPEMIVLGGPIGGKAGLFLLEPITREVERHALPMSLACLQIVSGSEGSESAAIGAAVLAIKSTTIERIFSSYATIHSSPA